MNHAKAIKRTLSIICIFVLILGHCSILKLSGQEEQRSVQLSAEEKAWLKAHPKIRLAPDPNFLPIEYIDENGEYLGIAADYARLIEQKLGITFEIICLSNWDEVIEKMQLRQVDVLNAAVKTPQREKYMLFPTPYLEIPSVIIVRKHVKTPLTLEKLQGMKVSVVSSYAYMDVLKTTYPKLNIDVVPDIRTGLRKVSFGMADAFVGDLATTSYYIEEEGITNLRIAGEAGPTNISGFGVRSDWPELIPILEKGMTLITEKEKRAIYRKWMHLEYDHNLLPKTFWNWLFLSIGVIAALFSGILFWNRSLKRQINLRTDELQRELTERKRTEEALRRSEDRFRRLAENAKDMIYRMSLLDGRYEYVSSAVTEITGYSPEEWYVNPELIQNVIHPDWRAYFEEQWKKLLKGEIAPFYEYKIIDKSGKERWLNQRNVLIYNNKKYPIAIEGIVTDITERKGTEETLRENEDRLKLALEGANDGLWDFYPQAGTVYYSPRWFTMLEYQPDEFPPVYETWQILLHPDDRAKAEGVIKNFIQEQGDFYSSEFRMQTKSGEWRWINSRGKAVEWDTHGNIKRIVGTHTDITEQKRAEEEHLHHLRFLRIMEQIDSIIRHGTELERMLQDIIQTVFSIFECDRAWLLFPCDPNAPSFRIPIEYVRSEYPVAFAVNDDIPMDIGTVRDCQMALASQEPLTFGLHAEYPVSEVIAQRFSVQSEICMAIHPKIGKPWLFGMHQCSYERIWTEEEQRLFKEIARRITEALSSLLFLRDLQQSEEKYKSLVASIPGAVYRCSNDPSWTMLFISDTIEEISGYPASDFIKNKNLTFADIIHPDDQTRVWEHVQHSLKQGKPYSVEYRIKIREGSMHWIFDRGQGVAAKDGTIKYLGGTLFDITLRKQTEEELQRLRNLLSDIINSMPSALVAVDLNGRITQWNRETEKMTGITADIAHGELLDRALPQIEKEMEMIRQAIQDKRPQKHEKMPWMINGKTSYMELTVYPLIESHIEGAVIRIDDVTERMKLENMMIQTEKMVSLGGLAAGMAHEINNPLGVILQGIQNTLRRLSQGLKKNQEVAERCGTDLTKIRAYLGERNILLYLQGIQEAGLRASKIVNNMLNFSHHSESTIIPTVINQLVDNTIELASNDYNLKKKYDFRHIKIIRDYDPKLIEIPCIPTEIEQVILNLLKNSAQAIAEKKEKNYTPQIKICTRKEETSATIEIEDNGPGMDEKTRKHIFEPFFTTKPVGTGTGLGLSVSYFIITDNHGGTITVESSPGYGTTFIIHLPLEKTENDTSLWVIS